MAHEVFISYNTKMKNIADRIVSTLESNDIKCWYAPRDVIGDYATSICDAVERAKIFVVLLDTNGSKSPHVLNEVEMAYKRIIQDDADLTILPFKLDKDELSKAMQYYIQRMHWIDASNDNIDDAIKELLSKVKVILKPYRNEAPKKRIANPIYEQTSDNERNRLKVQQFFLHQFDGDIYKKAFEEIGLPNILDIGTDDGQFILDAIKDAGDYSHLLGLDYNEKSVERANAKNANEKNAFLLVDVEKDDLDAIIDDYLIKNNLLGFDIINISMVLMHLSEPEKLLKRIRKYLNKGGFIIIKEVDDHLKLAFPDPQGLFEKAKELSIAYPYGGYRLSGRQIPHLLHKCGYKDTKLVKVGIDSLGLDYDEMDSLFEMCFGYFKEDYELFVENGSNDKKALEIACWFNEHYQELEDAFHEDGFFYMFGIVLYIARR